MKRLIVRSAVRIIVPYVLFLGLWTTAADRFLEALISDAHTRSLLLIYKDWGLIAVSAALLYLIVRHELRKRERAEAALAESGQKYRMLMQKANDGIVIADAETGRILEVNRQMEELTGLPAEKIIGMRLTELPPQENKERCQRILDDVIKHEHALANDLCIYHREGRPVPVEISASVLALGGKKVIQGIFRDITKRLQAEEQARYRLEHLTTLHAIDMMISSSLDLRVTLEEFLDLVISQLHVHAADVFLLNQQTQMLEYAAMRGFRDARVLHSPLRLGQGIAGLAALEHRSISIPNLLDPDSGYVRAYFLEGEGFIAYYVVPLIAKGQVKGVLEIYHRSPLTFDEEWMGFLEALAAQAAIAIDNASLFSDLQRSNADLVLAYDTTIEGWARALELRDKETEGHTKRAAEITLRIARAMGMSDAELVHVRRGALLHDIGKMSIPDSILFKTGPLSDAEWEIMRRHPVYAYELLSPISYLRPALDIPYCHHERWDGAGYPRRLKGEQIPLAARIFALADTWDALYSERRYHAALSEQEVREHIRSLAGAQLDPKVVEVFFRMEMKDRVDHPDAATT